MTEPFHIFIDTMSKTMTAEQINAVMTTKARKRPMVMSTGVREPKASIGDSVIAAATPDEACNERVRALRLA
jgi:hypothetical protein